MGCLGDKLARLACLKRYLHKGKIPKELLDEERAAKNNKTRIIAVGAAPRVSSSYSGIV